MNPNTDAFSTAPLCLADMAGMSEAEVFDHIAENYAGKDSGFSSGSPTAEEKAELRAQLGLYDLLIAYESVGLSGCDSSSWFLLRHGQTGEFFTIQGSHCSCYGFEGQGEIESTDPAYLLSDRFHFPTGGYDDEGDENEAAVKAAITRMVQP